MCVHCGQHTRTHARAQNALAHTHALTHIYTQTRTQIHTHTHILSLTHTRYLSLPHTHTHTHKYSLKLIHIRTHTHTHTHQHTNIHTHTHMHTYTYAHASYLRKHTFKTIVITFWHKRVVSRMNESCHTRINHSRPDFTDSRPACSRIEDHHGHDIGKQGGAKIWPTCLAAAPC